MKQKSAVKKSAMPNCPKCGKNEMVVLTKDQHAMFQMYIAKLSDTYYCTACEEGFTGSNITEKSEDPRRKTKHGPKNRSKKGKPFSRIGFSGDSRDFKREFESSEFEKGVLNAHEIATDPSSLIRK